MPLSVEDRNLVDEIVAQIDLQGWAILTNGSAEHLGEVARAAGANSLLSLGFKTDTDADLFDVVNEHSFAFAQARAAELVGMKWEDGDLIPNPDARWAITDGTRDFLRDQVSKAIEEGWSSKQLQDAIEDGYVFSPARASMIARTEIARAQEQGHLKGWKASGVVKGKQSILSQDHDELEPNGDECLAGETVVTLTSNLLRTFKRKYTGPIVEIHLTNGAHLTATPKHPVFTDSGWKPIGEITPGDYLVDASSWLERTTVTADYFNQAVSRIDKIVTAYRGTPTTLESSATDFHGDGAGSEVHTVTTDGLLWLPITKFPKLVEKSRLGWRVWFATHLTSYWNSCMRSLNLLHSTLWTREFIPKPLAFAPTTNGKPSTFKPPRNVVSRYSDQSRDSSSGQSRIEPSQILDTNPLAVSVSWIDRYIATLNVYNLTTNHGLYIANGVIVGNCNDATDDGVIPLDQAFSNGLDSPPYHPACKCAIVAITEDADNS